MKRISRIQTVITPLHRKKLEVLTNKYGTMNEVIERGIDLLEREDWISSTPLTSQEMLKLIETSEIFSSLLSYSGFAFIKADHINEFNQVLDGKRSLSEFYLKIRNWVVDDYEIRNVINKLTKNLENSFGSMSEILTTLSNTFRGFNLSIPEINDKKIVIYPNYYQKYPEIVALIIDGVLEHLGFNFYWKIQEEKIIYEWVDDPNAFINRSNYINEITLKYQNRQKLGTLKQNDEENSREKEICIKKLGIPKWKSGSYITGNKRYAFFPQEMFIELFKYILDTNNDLDILKKKIGKLILDVKTNKNYGFTSERENENELIFELLENLSYIFTYVLGWGKCDIIEKNILQITNPFMDKILYNEILNCILIDFKLQAFKVDSRGRYKKIRFIIQNASVKLLIVDDDKFWVSTISKFVENIKNFDTEVYTAHNGEDSLKLIEKYPFEVIICDYNLPGLNGIHVLNRARNFDSKTVRILMTGFDDRDIAIKAINEAKINYFIDKPPNPDELQEIIFDEIRKKRYFT